MRILDIGVAAGYAVLCISLIAILSPYPLEGSAVIAASDARASTALTAYVRTVGLQFLGTASPSELCSSLQASSNATVILGGGIGGSTCTRAPAEYAGKSSVQFTLSGEQVEIEAWVEGQ
ncbi:MAG: hypothetical protein ABSA72_06050 [Nitrososphaerales archaeon]|jgi:hypothetical protein